MNKHNKPRDQNQLSALTNKEKTYAIIVNTERVDRSDEYRDNIRAVTVHVLFETLDEAKKYLNDMADKKTEREKIIALLIRKFENTPDHHTNSLDAHTNKFARITWAIRCYEKGNFNKKELEQYILSNDKFGYIVDYDDPDNYGRLYFGRYNYNYKQLGRLIDEPEYLIQEVIKTDECKCTCVCAYCANCVITGYVRNVSR